MKKTIKILLLVFICAVTTSLFACGVEPPRGIIEQQNGFIYNLKDDNTYEVVGYKGEIKESVLNISNKFNGLPITSIGDGAFENNCEFRHLNFPNSITEIGDRAFYGCEEIDVVTLPESVLHIGDYAFANCNSIEIMYFSTKLKTMGKGVLNGSNSVENILLPFVGDAKENPIEEHFSYLFGDDGLVPHSLTAIAINSSGNYHIPNYAFKGIESLEEIVNIEGVNSIGSEAFADCESLINVFISPGVQSVGESIFKGCGSLFNLNFSLDVKMSNGEKINSIGYLFGDQKYYKEQEAPITFNKIIINGGSNIPSNFFAVCNYITNITFGQSVTSIEKYAFWGLELVEVSFYSHLDWKVCRYAESRLLNIEGIQSGEVLTNTYVEYDWQRI